MMFIMKSNKNNRRRRAKLGLGLGAFASLMCTMANLSVAGTKDSGGDPMTQQFIEDARKLAIYFLANPYRVSLPFDSKDFDALAGKIDESIKDEGLPDMVEFTDEKLKDKGGVEKSAVFFEDPILIRVNRAAWKNFSTEERLVQVIMELSGLLKTPKRYEEAQGLIEGRASVIASIPLRDPSKKYSKPGWRLVGEDPDQFGEVSQQDEFFDVGELGKGDEANRLAVEFFKNPLQYSWSDSIVRTIAEKRKAFIVSSGVDQKRATVSVVTLQRVAPRGEGNPESKPEYHFKVYSLRFKKIGTAFVGPCADPLKLPPHQRVTLCYLDSNLYYAEDDVFVRNFGSELDPEKYWKAFESLMRCFGDSLTEFYALNSEVLAEALRSFYITDYSRTVRDNKSNIILQAAVSAHGLEASLMGPFDEAKFWRKTGTPNPKAIRLYAAAQALAENGLVFTGINMSCPEKKGLIIEKAEYDRLISSDSCVWHGMGYQFDATLFSAMVEAGFRYDPAARKWARGEISENE